MLETELTNVKSKSLTFHVNKKTNRTQSFLFLIVVQLFTPTDRQQEKKEKQ